MTIDMPEPAPNDYAESVEDNEVTLITLPSEANEPEVPLVPEAPVPAAVEPASEADSDIWMATLDDDPTPRASRLARSTQSTLLPSSPEREPSSSQVGDFGYLPPAGSDYSSIDEPMSETGPRDSDTIAQGEDFSMIFMDSLPSLRSSVNVPAEADFGDETSLIINNTLESLRQSLRKSVQQHNEPSQHIEPTVAHEPSLPPKPVNLVPNDTEHVEPGRVEPLYIESDHSELDDIEPEHVEPERVEPEDVETMHDDSEYAEIEDFGPEHRPEHIEPENSEDEAPEPEGTEHELEQLEPKEYESPVIDAVENVRGNIEPEITEIGPVEHDLIDLSEPAAPVEVRQPTIRPPAPFSPNRILSPRWLRSPKRGNTSPLRHQLLKFKARQTDDSPPRAASEKLDQPPAPSPQQRKPSHFNEGQSNLYEDSFSEIPHDVLEAATPRRPRAVSMDEEVAVEKPIEEEPIEVRDGDDQEMEDLLPSQQTEDLDATTVASTTSHLSQSDRGRLPTPDDTPPQIDVDADDQGKSAQQSQASAGPASQTSSSPMISPGRQFQGVSEVVEEMIMEVEDVEDVDDDISEVLEMPQMPQIPEILEPQPEDASESSPESHVIRPEVTPVNQMTSPLQEPQSLAPELILEKTSRPLLSPIVRAGRALQSVTSDPPSPEPRENQLRSPFRSSVTRELGPQDTQVGGHFRSSVTRDLGPHAQDAQAGGRMSASPRRPLVFPTASQAPSVNPVYDDPFASGSRHTGQISFMEALERSSGYPASSQRALESPIDSVASSMHINPPDDVQMSWVANEGPISANLRGDVPLKDLAPPKTTEGTGSSMPRDQPENHRAVDEAPHETEDKEDEEDEIDLWEFEAQREAPRTTRQQPFGNRRTGLPSPWTRQAEQSPQRDVPMTSQGEHEQGEIAPSVSDADRTEEDVQEEDIPEEAVPEQQGDEFSLLAQREAAKEPQHATQSANKANRFDLSSFFSSPAAIPGMLAEKLLPGKSKAIYASRPSEPEPESAQIAATLPTSSMFPQVAQKEFRPRASSRGTDLFSPIRGKEQEPRREATSSPKRAHDDEEDVEMRSVSQKQNFTPRPKQPQASFFKPTIRSGAPTPPRMQLSHADIQKWQQETASETSPEVRRPLLRPLPPKNASPIKSSLRSPLKPHTPGRVVEFTSSVLSPVEQAKARQMRRLSNLTASQASVAPQRPPRQTLDKENHTSTASDVAMSEASPAAKSPQPEPLSQSVWGREHWLFLDQLLQLRRAGPYDFSYERRTDKFLGKTVKTQNEAMLLERWHLDCVDAFKAEVGGWDEADLIRRLFSLIKGEEKRSLGVVKRPTRVMFH